MRKVTGNIAPEDIIVSVKPKDHDIALAEGQEEYLTLYAHLNSSPDAPAYYMTYWKPNKLQLQKLLEGKCICLNILAQQHPPVLLDIVDDPS